LHAGSCLLEGEFAQLLLVLDGNVAGGPAGDVMRLPDKQADQQQRQQQDEAEHAKAEARATLLARGILARSLQQPGERGGRGVDQQRLRVRIRRADGKAAFLLMPEEEQLIVVEAAQGHADLGERYLDAPAVDEKRIAIEGG